MSEQNIPESFNTEVVATGKPLEVWIALGALTFITLLQIIAAVSRNSGGLFVGALCNMALIVGLYRGHKWAYVVLIVFSIGGAVVAFGNSVQKGLVVLLLNAVVLVPILMSTRFFFPREQKPDLRLTMKSI
ncbi:MAG: hypothetical protein H0X66_08455 [Verrucomicrobia bacterium]|nr:hypothetical protein [Verrucomicrobiota bacterium]